MRWSVQTILLMPLILGASGGAMGFEVYHSPANDGTNPGVPAGIVATAGATLETTLHLYVDHADGVPASTPCAGSELGAGICMWNLKLVADPGLTIVSYLAAPPLDPASIVALRQDALLRWNGGDPLAGDTGPTFVGDVIVTSSTAGSQLKVSGEWVDDMLQLNPLGEQVLAASTCDDSDGDGICNFADPCIAYPNTPASLLQDANADGIPDECQCGDTDANGVLAFSDGTRSFRCAAAAPAVGVLDPGPNCDISINDTNNNGLAEFSDGTRIFTVAAAIVDSWQLSCARRPEATPPP